MNIHQKILQKAKEKLAIGNKKPVLQQQQSQNSTKSSYSGQTAQSSTLKNEENSDSIPDFEPSPYLSEVHQHISEIESIEATQQLANHFNSTKECIRPTTDIFPKQKNIQYDTRLKFAVIISPLGPKIGNYPIATTKAKGIIRCENCRAYMNPFCQFMMEGYKYKCNICDKIQAVPIAYQCELDNNGYRRDLYDRPELCTGSFDIIAGEEYSQRSPIPPTYMFLIDVSTKAVESGMVAIAAEQIKYAVQNNLLANGESRCQVGILTFNSRIHVYNLKASLKQPQMFVIEDGEIPIPDELLVTLEDSKELFLNLLETLPKMFQSTPDDQSCFMLALETCNRIIKSSGGRLFIFQANSELVPDSITIPKAVDNSAKTGQSSEQKSIILGDGQAPSTEYFRNMCTEMQLSSIHVSIFIFSEQYKHIIALADLARYLNGEIFYYHEKEKQFEMELRNTLEKQVSWDSVFRIRVTNGYRISNVYGNFTVKQNDLLSFPCDEYTNSHLVGGNQTLVYEFEMESARIAGNTVSIQTALLYTPDSGERRIRTHNYIIPLSSDPRDIYDKVDATALSAVIAKANIMRIYYHPTYIIKKEIIQTAKEICLTGMSVNRNKLQENLEPLCLHVLGLLKHPILNSSYGKNQVTTDQINAWRIQYQSMRADELINHFVPQLFSINELMVEDNLPGYDKDGAYQFPECVDCSFNSLGKTMYLFDQGYQLVLYVDPEGETEGLDLISDVFGSLDGHESLTEDNLFYDPNSKVSQMLNQLIYERKSTKYCPLLVAVAGTGSALEHSFYYKLIVDKYPQYIGGCNLDYEDFINTLLQ